MLRDSVGLVFDKKNFHKKLQQEICFCVCVWIKKKPLHFERINAYNSESAGPIAMIGVSLERSEIIFLDRSKIKMRNLSIGPMDPKL